MIRYLLHPNVTDWQAYQFSDVISRITIHQIFLLSHDWSKHITWPNIPRIFPNFQNHVHCEKDLKDHKHDSFHLGQKYAWIFVLGHYLLFEAAPQKTVRISEQIMSADKYPCIFSCQMMVIVYLVYIYRSLLWIREFDWLYHCWLSR